MSTIVVNVAARWVEARVKRCSERIQGGCEGWALAQTDAAKRDGSRERDWGVRGSVLPMVQRL